MEVAGVLCETLECCLRIDDGIEGLRHGYLHRLVVCVLVWFIV